MKKRSSGAGGLHMGARGLLRPFFFFLSVGNKMWPPPPEELLANGNPLSTFLCVLRRRLELPLSPFSLPVLNMRR